MTRNDSPILGTLTIWGAGLCGALLLLLQACTLPKQVPLTERVPALSQEEATNGCVEALKGVLKAHPGECPVFLLVGTKQGRQVIVGLPNTHFVSPSEVFCADIEEVLGKGHLRFAGKRGK